MSDPADHSDIGPEPSFEELVAALLQVQGIGVPPLASLLGIGLSNSLGPTVGVVARAGGQASWFVGSSTS